MHCTKISLEFKSRVKGQIHRGQKKRKTAESSSLTVHRTAYVVGRTQQAATDNTIAWPPGCDGLRRWENQRILSSFSLSHFIRLGVATMKLLSLWFSLTDFKHLLHFA